MIAELASFVGYVALGCVALATIMLAGGFMASFFLEDDDDDE